MWSCLHGSGGSSWPVLEVQRTPASLTSRNGKNSLSYLFFFNLIWIKDLCKYSQFVCPSFNTPYFNACVYVRVIHTQVYSCCWDAVFSAWTVAETERAEQQIQQRWHIHPQYLSCRAWEIYAVLNYKPSHKVRNGFKTLFNIKWYKLNIDMCCCACTLQCSGGWETACHAELNASTSNTEDWRALQSCSEVRLHLKQLI